MNYLRKNNPFRVRSAGKQKVLIVDDSPLILKILTNMLAGDYDVICAPTGEEALQAAVREIPDIILLDVVLTGMSGYDVCKVIKKDPATANIPIIFISCLNDESDEKTGLELGAIDYITKPFSEAIVKIRIKNHLELKSHRDFFERLSSLDGLTGIYNRRFFDYYYIQEWNRAIGDRTPISLILIDIDRFKCYNDNYGHLMGDDCLRQVSSAILRSLLRKEDTVARYGGEEFICVLPNCESEDAFCISERIMKNIEDLQIRHDFSDVTCFVTASIGAGTVIPHDFYEPNDFLGKVDELLFEAKRSGRNTVRARNIYI